MQSMPIRKRRFYFYILLVVFFIIIPIITLYTSGYRIGDNFKLVETGGVYIYSPEVGSEIYINNKKEKETSIFQRDLFVQNLKPGTYTILVSKNGFWPWAKEVKVEERMVAEAIAFLIPQDPDGEIIPEMIVDKKGGAGTATTTKENPEYKVARKLFEKDNTNTIAGDETGDGADQKKFEHTSGRGRVGIWLDENNEVFAAWLKDKDNLPNYFCREDVCEDTVLVFNGTVPVKSLSFYPGREDVVLLALSNGIFAIEIDARKNQNFQPVYKGVDPYFVIEDNTLYVKDKENFLKIHL